MKLKPEYNHKDKAASLPDKFKHAVLLNIIDYHEPKSYFETHCGFSVYYIPQTWESSWMKAYRWGVRDMVLCDTNPDVGESMPPYATIEFRCTDGFEERLKSDADLTFIDPPYVDVQDWERVEYLTSKINNWVVWYPVFRNDAERFKNSPKIEMLWTTTNRMRGCGMAFADNIGVDFIYESIPFIGRVLSAQSWFRKNF